MRQTTVTTEILRATLAEYLRLEKSLELLELSYAPEDRACSLFGTLRHGIYGGIMALRQFQIWMEGKDGHIH